MRLFGENAYYLGNRRSALLAGESTLNLIFSKLIDQLVIAAVLAAS